MSKGKAKEAIAGILTQRQLEVLDRLKGQHEKALGKLAMRFSLLHVALEWFSWKAWNLDPRSGRILTRDLRVTHLAEKLERTAEYVIPRMDNRKKLLSILKEIKKVAEKRNDLLHSIWFIREGEPMWCFSRTRGELAGTNAPSVEQINELCSTINNILEDFGRFEEKNPLMGMGLLGMNLGSGENTGK